MAQIRYQNHELSWKPQLWGKPRLHRLKVRDGFVKSRMAERVFQQFGLGYLICHKFPRVIQTNFPVPWPIRQLIEKMYVYYGHEFLEWKCPVFREKKQLVFDKLSSSKAVVTLSGGKDGLYYLLRCIEQYGSKNVLPVHISHLSMEGVSHRELRAAKKLSHRLNMELRVIDLVNSSRIPGPKIMHFRELFMLAMLTVEAHEFGADKIFIEGSDDSRASGHQYFSDLDSSYETLRDILGEWGIPIEICSESISEYEVLRRMYANADWAALMPFTHSCLRCDRLMIFCRKWYKSRFPKLFKHFYEGQCGSCFKCRVITLARILWDPLMQPVSREERKEYLVRTEEWREKLGNKYKDSLDFVHDPSFIKLISEVKCQLT